MMMMTQQTLRNHSSEFKQGLSAISVKNRAKRSKAMENIGKHMENIGEIAKHRKI